MARWFWIPTLAVILGLGGFLAYVLFYEDCSFDRVAWDEGRSERHNARYEALGHDAELLVRCETLQGMTPAEVEDLLGRPSHEYRAGSVWGYDIGVPAALSDYPELSVTFWRGEVADLRIGGYEAPPDAEPVERLLDAGYERGLEAVPFAYREAAGPVIDTQVLERGETRLWAITLAGPADEAAGVEQAPNRGFAEDVVLELRRGSEADFADALRIARGG